MFNLSSAELAALQSGFVSFLEQGAGIQLDSSIALPIVAPTFISVSPIEDGDCPFSVNLEVMPIGQRMVKVLHVTRKSEFLFLGSTPVSRCSASMLMSELSSSMMMAKHFCRIQRVCMLMNGFSTNRWQVPGFDGGAPALQHDPHSVHPRSRPSTKRSLFTHRHLRFTCACLSTFELARCGAHSLMYCPSVFLCVNNETDLDEEGCVAGDPNIDSQVWSLTEGGFILYPTADLQLNGTIGEIPSGTFINYSILEWRSASGEKPFRIYGTCVGANPKS